MRKALNVFVLAFVLTIAGTTGALAAPAKPESTAQQTGVSSLLQAQNQYQALNVYSEPDPADGR